MTAYAVIVTLLALAGWRVVLVQHTTVANTKAQLAACRGMCRTIALMHRRAARAAYQHAVRVEQLEREAKR